MQNGVVVIGLGSKEINKRIDDCFSASGGKVPLKTLEAITVGNWQLPLIFFQEGDSRISKYAESGFRAYVVKEDIVYKDQSLLEQQT